MKEGIPQGVCNKKREGFKFTTMKFYQINRLMIVAALMLAHASVLPGRMQAVKTVKVENLKGREIVALGQVDTLRYQLWRQWKSNLKKAGGQRLIYTSTLDTAHVGYLHLPDSLEANATMPYYWGTKGTLAYGNNVFLPTFVYIHGSGPKEQEWAAGISWCKIFSDAPSRYFIPQIPNEGEYYRWWQRAKQWGWRWLWDQLMQDDSTDPNRIYLFGISEGAYGSQRLASFYADYLAAVGPMAGGEPLENCPPENIGNIGFSLLTGEKDFMFGRNILTQHVSNVLDSLQTRYPGEYVHRVHLIPNMGHGIDYRPTTPWLQQFRRNPWPKHFIWEDYEMDGIHRNGFYNIRVDRRPSDTIRTRYDVCIANNHVDIQARNVKYISRFKEPNWGITVKWEKELEVTDDAALTVFLNEHLVDLSKKVTVTLNGKEVFCGKLRLTKESMLESLKTYRDPFRIFPAAVKIIPR